MPHLPGVGLSCPQLEGPGGLVLWWAGGFRDLYPVLGYVI